MDEQVLPLPLKRNDHITSCFYIPPAEYKRLTSILAELSFGSKSIACQILPHPEGTNHYELSGDLWDYFGIPFETDIHVFQKDHVLHLGPLVGVFTAGFTKQAHRPVGKRSFLFAKYLASTAKIGGFYFIFGSHQINWETGEITGLFYTEKGWNKQIIPFPHVVYDRIPNRKAEQLPMCQTIKKRMENDYLIPWFNSGFFNKWNVYEKLQHETISQFLPETILNPSLLDMEALLHKYDHFYLKPANGSLGHGIYHIQRKKDDPHYYCRSRLNGKNVFVRYKNLDQFIEDFLQANKLETMIAQQGITLMRINNRPLDFRIHVNKNIHGKWQISAIAAKISGQNSITTHIASGGSVKTVHELIASNEKFTPLIKRLEEVTLLLSKAFDSSMSGRNGEIGFDLGIDIDERIWLFEANSKPGRGIFAHPKLKNEELMTRILPFEYSIYLAKTAITKPGLLHV